MKSLLSFIFTYLSHGIVLSMVNFCFVCPCNFASQAIPLGILQTISSYVCLLWTDDVKTLPDLTGIQRSTLHRDRPPPRGQLQDRCPAASPPPPALHHLCFKMSDLNTFRKNSPGHKGSDICSNNRSPTLHITVLYF